MNTEQVECVLAHSEDIKFHELINEAMDCCRRYREGRDCMASLQDRIMSLNRELICLMEASETCVYEVGRDGLWFERSENVFEREIKLLEKATCSLSMENGKLCDALRDIKKIMRCYDKVLKKVQ